jgi:AraC-like DNA-binding protein
LESLHQVSVMVYLEAKPSLPLAGVIRFFWYASAPDLPYERERVLPNGSIQVVISLATDQLTDCEIDRGEDLKHICRALPPAILVGARGKYDIIHTRDMKELVGIVFRPGGLGPWLRQPANLFFERSVSLDDVWGTRNMRDPLREEESPARKLAKLEALLVERLNGRAVARRPIIRAALTELNRGSVRRTASSLGVSERRLHQVFSEDVGLSPKLWSRVHRFQRAVHALYAGGDMPWEQLALACGYYDQSHFSNDFRAFSGIDPTTYSTHQGQWRNHVACQ